MRFYNVKISKEFIEGANSEFDAESEALDDMKYNLDSNIHTLKSIRENVKIETRPLTEEEFKEVEKVMKIGRK